MEQTDKHPKHSSLIPSHGIFADGFAIGSYDVLHDVYRFRWYDEDFTVEGRSVHPTSHAPWGWLAPIEAVRRAAIAHEWL